MAETGVERLKKLAGGGSSVVNPTKEFPRPPKALLEFGPPEVRKAWEEWLRSIDEWRKTLS
jgi:hypothetical protein